MNIKCKNCRKLLVSEDSKMEVISAHGSSETEQYSNCYSISHPTSIYFEPESAQNVDWIQKVIADSEWSKGKLKCPSCQVVVGSFSFLTSIPCQCAKYQLPSLQLIVSKVDVKKDLPIA